MGPQAVRLRAPQHHVSPRAKWYWALMGLRIWIVLGIAQTIWWLNDHSDAAARHIVLAIVILAMIGYLALMPQWRYRVHRWEVTGEAVYTQTGWVTVERRIAPISRIQTVDTERGPIEQLFGLANVTVTTASAAGPLRIHGLRRVDADDLVEHLTATTQATTGDAT
ncbi:MAG: PH domain-containing protein [Jatrophihabitans sp.]